MIRTKRAPLSVLVVDDNHDVADSTGELLTLYGCQVHVCYDGSSALEYAKDHPPELCLFDLNMPGMDGDELAERVREVLPNRPICFAAITALNGEEAHQRIMRAGFQRHLIKPVDLVTLLDMVEE